METILRIVSHVKEFCSDIIIINDGSTDGTSELLRTIENIDLIEFERTRGRGIAIKAGFIRAIESGYSHVVTFDVDGRHMAEEIPLFFQKIQEEPLTLWIGESCIPAKSVCRQPLFSRFGNKLAVYWFKFSTGLFIKNIQCSFRAYPLLLLKNLQYKTGDQYDFEIEILILAAWNHLSVKSIPIHFNYSLHDERVSHFRKISDYVRVFRSMGALFLPSKISSEGSPWTRIVKYIKCLIRNELKNNSTPFKAAVSLSLGVFMAITPFHGLQVLFLIAATFIFKLNRPLAFLGVSISSAPFLPFWLAAGTVAGKITIPDKLVYFTIHNCKFLTNPFFVEKLNKFGTGIVHTFVQYFFGSIILAAVCSILTLGISFLLFRLKEN